jgi:hypothetical protein
MNERTGELCRDGLKLAQSFQLDLYRLETNLVEIGNPKKIVAWHSFVKDG